MSPFLTGKTYLQKLQTFAFSCLGFPLVFFIYVYLESSVDELVAVIPVDYHPYIFIPMMLICFALIYQSIKTFKARRSLAMQSDSLNEKLALYLKANNQRFLIYAVCSTLITFGFYLTNYQPFAGLFAIMIVMFSINNPNARRIVTDLKLKDNEKKIILEGSEIN